jgi:hypothetical protein
MIPSPFKVTKNKQNLFKRGNPTFYLEAEERLRYAFQEGARLTDASEIKAKVDLASQVAIFLRKNLAQATLIQQNTSKNSNNKNTSLVYRYRIQSYHEMNDNTSSSNVVVEGDEEEREEKLLKETVTQIGQASFKSFSACAGAPNKVKKLKTLGPCRVRCEDCTCGAPPAAAAP